MIKTLRKRFIRSAMLAVILVVAVLIGALLIGAYTSTRSQLTDTLDMLSEKVSLSKYYLSHEFKRYMGVAPMQYLQYVRLENAKLMLLHTKLPVRAVAQEVGFSDVNNFDRQFLRHTGVTPVRFRKSNQNSR